MKKIAVNFEDITNEVIEAIAKEYPQGFIESDIISFSSNLNTKMEDRVKLIVNEKLYLIKKAIINDVLTLRYEEGYFSSLSDIHEDVDI